MKRPTTPAEALRLYQARTKKNPLDYFDEDGIEETYVLSLNSKELIDWAKGRDREAKAAAVLALEGQRERPRKSVVAHCLKVLTPPELRGGYGRPTRLTPEVFSEIVRGLEEGNFLEHVLDSVGVSKAAVASWRDRGELELARIDKGEKEDPSEAIFASFAIEVARAKAEATRSVVSAVRRSAEGGAVRARRYDDHGNVTAEEFHPPNVAAQVFFLERTRPEDWGRTRVEVTGADGGPIMVSPVDEIRSRLDQIAQRNENPVRADEAV